MSQQNVLQGENVRLNANTFTRNGYEFVKWNTQSNGAGTSYNDKANISPTSDLTLYAHWDTYIEGLSFNMTSGGHKYMENGTYYRFLIVVAPKTTILTTTIDILPSMLLLGKRSSCNFFYFTQNQHMTICRLMESIIAD